MKLPQLTCLAAAAAAAVVLTSGVAVAATPAGGLHNIVLVHGALVDSSGWRDVYDILARDGYHVTAVQEPLAGFDGDVAATARVLQRQDGPVLLVGHSYGGAVITAAGTDPRVKALVYVAAFAPDAGETIGALNATLPTDAGKYLQVGADGYLSFAPAAQFAALVGSDLPAATGNFMAASQVLMAASSFGVKLTAAAWRDKPSFAIVATEDKIISPALERSMYRRAGATVTEIKSGHMVYMSHPAEVAAVIETAARSVH